MDTNDILDAAIVDPGMMSTIPKDLTAFSGMDALTSTIEGYTTKAAFGMVDCLNMEAIHLIYKNLRSAVANEGAGWKGMIWACSSPAWPSPM